MKITQDVRDYAATLNDRRSAHCGSRCQRRRAHSGGKGMAQMSKKFLDIGADVYVDADKVKESNKAL